jgi:transcriptional regulator with XRE-family HTH domain
MIIMQEIFLMERFSKTMVYSGDVMAGRPPTKEATDFGKRVAAARQQRGLTQRELADRIGVSLRMMEYYERRADNVKSDVIKALAHALNVSTDDLLGVNTPKSKPGPKSKLRKQIDKVEQLPRSRQLFVAQVLDQLLTAEYS